ncbi:MAG: baseplate J/gp47 family protein [Janthinobacterium lividum]
MNLTLLTRTALVSQFAAGAQAVAGAALSILPGSLTLAWADANSGVALWLQKQNMDTLLASRLSTATGPDVDSWVADYQTFGGRLPAVAASGALVFSRLTTGTAALVPVGAMAKTLDGTQSFVVVADATNPTFSPTAGATPGYYVTPDAAGVTVAVQAVNPGTQGNVGANTVGLPSSSIAGIDTVTNPAAFTNGVDAETDAAVKARFQNFMATRSEGTADAVAFAISSLQQGLTFSLLPNVDTQGGYRPGHFVVVVDDGTGAPPASVISAVYAAVAAVAALTITFDVIGPQVTLANLSALVTTTPGADHAGILAAISAAWEAYIGGLGVGAALSWGRLFALAFNADPAVTDVQQLTLNGGSVDLVVLPNGEIRVGTVALS